MNERESFGFFRSRDVICGSEKNRLVSYILIGLSASSSSSSSLSERTDLLGTGVLGDRLGSLADGVLGEFTGQQKPDGRLYFATGDRRTFVVVRETGRLGGYALEYVVDEAVHDAHRLARDAGVRVNLLEHLVDVDGVALLPATLLLLVALGDVLLRLAGLLRRFTACFRWHFDLDCELLRACRSRTSNVE